MLLRVCDVSYILACYPKFSGKEIFSKPLSNQCRLSQLSKCQMQGCS